MEALNLEKKAPASEQGGEHLQELQCTNNYNINSFNLTLFTATNDAVLTKKYEAQNDSILSTPCANLSMGTYQTASFKNATELNFFLTKLRLNQAVCIGIPVNGSSSGQIVTKHAESNNPLEGAISRTIDNFEFTKNAVLDIDHSSLEIDEVIPTLIEIHPQLKYAHILVRASSSYGISLEGQSADLSNCSYHVWVGGIKYPSDIPRYGKAFAQRCWLHGLGHIQISATGSMLVKQLIDSAVFSPERLVFEANPVLGEGIVQVERPYRIQEAA